MQSAIIKECILCENQLMKFLKGREPSYSSQLGHCTQLKQGFQENDEYFF